MSKKSKMWIFPKLAKSGRGAGCLKNEQNQAQLGRFVKIVKDFPKWAKIEKKTGPVVSKKSKMGIFPNLAKRCQGAD